MTAPPVFPIVRLLVPAAATAAPAELTDATFALTAGVPATFNLTTDLTLTVVVPTGQVQAVLDTDGSAVASSDIPQRAAFDGTPDTVGSVARLPARIVLMQSGTVLGALPLVAGLRSVFPDDGVTGVAVEVEVVEWTINTGTLVGPGAFGSILHIAWRALGAGSDAFQPPAIDPSIVTRLLDPRQAQSTLGPAVQRASGGYAPAPSADGTSGGEYSDWFDDIAYAYGAEYASWSWSS